MTFAHPWILWLLPLGLIPIVIYYLLRFRSLRVRWGANYVLERALERLKRRLHLDQVILMGLRMLAIMVVVAAFARPMFRQPAATVSGTGVHRVILLDNSYSMTAAPAPAATGGAAGDGKALRSRWDLALDTARRLVVGWGRGETWSLCVLDTEPRWLVERQPVGSPDQAVARLESLRPGEHAASISAALAQVTQKFANDKLQVFILADNQASAWADVERAPLPSTPTAEIFWVNPAGEPGVNLAITAVRPASDRLLAGHPGRVAVAVRNFSSAKVEDARVELLLDGSFVARQSLSLLPDQEITLRFDFRPAGAGSHYLTAQLPEDVLPFDNQSFAALEATDRLTVAVLRDPRRTGKFDSTWGFVETLERSADQAAPAGIGDSHAATATSDPASSPAAVSMVASGAGRIVWKAVEAPLNQEALAGVDVVLLDGGVRLSADLATALRDFVARGGGLILAGDPGVDAAVWNHELARVDLLPARLGALRTEALGGERFRSLARDPISVSPLRVFEGDDAGDLAQARLYTWFDLQPIDARTDTVLPMDDQSPWALRRIGETGLGRAVQLATGLGGAGNNLAVREFYVPLLHALAQDAAASGIFPRSVIRGQPMRLRLTDPTSVTAVTFARHGDDAQPIVPRKLGVETLVEAGGPGAASGLYSFLTVRGGASQRSWFAVQGPRVDSNLAPLAPARVEELRQRLGMTVASGWAELDAALQAQRAGREWHGWALAAAIAFLIGEMLFQRRFAPEPARATGPVPSRRPTHRTGAFAAS